ncbi:MAG TPA: hypothetical protein VN493_21090 [Thermoanaerobaculia bacterium]|nr:hypothetical protein [Thermoanaerobaculia bacterium]
MNRIALSLAFLLALCLVVPLHAQPAAAPLAASLCPVAAQPAADSIDLAKIAAPKLICEQCPLEQGENCLFPGQECSWRPGCTCRANLVCCR